MIHSYSNYHGIVITIFNIIAAPILYITRARLRQASNYFASYWFFVPKNNYGHLHFNTTTTLASMDHCLTIPGDVLYNDVIYGWSFSSALSPALSTNCSTDEDLLRRQKLLCETEASLSLVLQYGTVCQLHCGVMM